MRLAPGFAFRRRRRLPSGERVDLSERLDAREAAYRVVISIASRHEVLGDVLADQWVGICTSVTQPGIFA